MRTIEAPDLFTPSGDNVVEFRRREPGEDLDAIARAPRSTCTHLRRRVVDEELRRVTCGDCGEQLDPVWCLLTLVKYHEQIERRIAELKALEQQHERARLERQARAMQFKQRTRAAQDAERSRKHCQACQGTGWITGDDGARRCGCRNGKGPRLV